MRQFDETVIVAARIYNHQISRVIYLVRLGRPTGNFLERRIYLRGKGCKISNAARYARETGRERPGILTKRVQVIALGVDTY